MIENRKYYEAYDERYKTAHEKGVSWEHMKSTPIIMEIIKHYNLSPKQSFLEIGCGEGRDSKEVLENGYDLLATDISTEAIKYCKKTMPDFKTNFRVLDCLSDDLEERFDFIYAVAVVHMLVAGTSCRMVSFGTFENELQKNKLQIIEQGITSAIPNFNSLMYAVVKK